MPRPVAGRMRCSSLFAALPLTLLGCTFHTYSGQTLPENGFGAQAAPARVVYGGGGEVAAAEPRDARRGWGVTRAPRSTRDEVTVSERSEPSRTGQSGHEPSRADASQRGREFDVIDEVAVADGAKVGRVSSASNGGGESGASTGGREVRQAAGKPSSSAKPAAGARPKGGVVVLARGKTPVDERSGSVRAPRAPRSSRGIAPVSHVPARPRTGALAVLKTGGDDERERAQEPGASGTAQLASGPDEASSTARLARSQRGERMRSGADERATLATN